MLFGRRALVVLCFSVGLTSGLRRRGLGRGCNFELLENRHVSIDPHRRVAISQVFAHLRRQHVRRSALHGQFHQSIDNAPIKAGNRARLALRRIRGVVRWRLHVAAELAPRLVPCRPGLLGKRLQLCPGILLIFPGIRGIFRKLSAFSSRREWTFQFDQSVIEFRFRDGPLPNDRCSLCRARHQFAFTFRVIARSPGRGSPRFGRPRRDGCEGQWSIARSRRRCETATGRHARTIRSRRMLAARVVTRRGSMERGWICQGLRRIAAFAANRLPSVGLAVAVRSHGQPIERRPRDHQRQPVAPRHEQPGHYQVRARHLHAGRNDACFARPMNRQLPAAIQRAATRLIRAHEDILLLPAGPVIRSHGIKAAAGALPAGLLQRSELSTGS